MLSFTHLFIGAAVGSATGNPALGFGAGVLSHHLGDATPHFDTVAEHWEDREQITPAHYIFAAVEGLVGFGLLAYVLHQTGTSIVDPASPAAWGAFGGVAPDLVDNVPLWSQWFRGTRFGRVYHRFHDWFHFALFTKEFWWWPVGILTQIVLIGASIGILYMK